MTNLTPVTQETMITVGMTLVEQNARLSSKSDKILTIKKINKKFITMDNERRYTREGYLLMDDGSAKGKRNLYVRLYIKEDNKPAETTNEIKAAAPETSIIEERQANDDQKQTMNTPEIKPVDETMNIEAGATLYHQCPVRGMRTVKVARTTKTLIILEDGGRYNRKGYATGDTWKRHVLYIEVKESAEETSKVAAPQKTIESRKEQRTLAQVAENNAEVTKKLEKLNGFVEQYNAAPSQFHKNRIDEQLMWFQRHDISITMDNGDYVLVKDDEEQEQTLEAKGASETTNESAQETDEVVNETIAELKAATPAERFPDALRMSMKVLEMDKTLDDATKALAYSAYLQALADAMCPPQTTNEIQQCMQRKREKEAISSDKRKKATQHYEAFVKEQEALKDAKEQLKALRAAGESAAMSAKKNATGTTAQKLDAIRAAWVPFRDVPPPEGGGFYAIACVSPVRAKS